MDKIRKKICIFAHNRLYLMRRKGEFCMNHTKVGHLAIFAVILLSAGEAEVLTWKANAGKQFNVQVRTRESVTGLNSIPKNPKLFRIRP
jgi:hypothetical protein